MARILGVGIATLDIINTVDFYPAEDTEVRATRQRINRGGNATNTLVVLNQLGHTCAWAGTLADEPDARHIQEDLARYHIDTSHVSVTTGKVPTSYITVSEATGSRTIVHHRDLPEYSFTAFQQIDLSQYEWVHFEGRNVGETVKMLRHADEKYPRLRTSLEIEKQRPGIEALFELPQVIMFSRAYARQQGFVSAESFLRQQRNQCMQADIICAWGEGGADAMARGSTSIVHAPAFTPKVLVDTLGAGDTFNAGLVDAYLKDYPLPVALTHANQLAGQKCGVHGLHLAG